MATFPITRLTAKAFGPFADIDIEFAPGVNVIVGDNATGKSQLLKLLYSCTKTLKEADSLTKRDLNGAIGNKLDGVFRPDSLGRLSRRGVGTVNTSVSTKFKGIGTPLSFSFTSRAKRDVTVSSIPDKELTDEPVFLPPHELLSLGARFIALFNEYETGFEETWRDTVQLLQLPALRGRRGDSAGSVMKPFSNLLQGGTVYEEGGQFYLRQPGIGNLEASLLAEGHRKLATVVRLIANGALLEGGYLFWDEPEANLNPQSQRAVAAALIHLANSGAQIFVASHSMFLLRELQMASDSVSPRYVTLRREEASGETVTSAAVEAEASNDLDELSDVAALEAEASQAQRYLNW